MASKNSELSIHYLQCIIYILLYRGKIEEWKIEGKIGWLVLCPRGLASALSQSPSNSFKSFISINFTSSTW